ncbi:hypothetical protein [Mesorhizobium sp. M1B.F.Ca.ET.045.04.1.1]|uniref:hypothetical protein n=1 Tax=Mesorhizobium sp. M1B.F.Ca.ET.045.04.1.1 TaxID=2493673 RepID=UPI000F7542AA|nr:hypothetical protein [Mesorhizobium sp. M1B.F.Ca.ET.045.04.1.1]AZO29366.1 hypothetical protein EJ071_19565 [Mesorhizobium sp. M1B.F.Ca.ET.045.04.1.1]
MAEFSLEIKMDNAAFADDPGGEVARILRDIADKVTRGDGFTIGEATGTPIRDVNGNRVGTWFADLEDLESGQ